MQKAKMPRKAFLSPIALFDNFQRLPEKAFAYPAFIVIIKLKFDTHLAGHGSKNNIASKVYLASVQSTLKEWEPRS